MAQVSLDEASAAGVNLYGGTGLLSFFFDHDRFAGVGTGSLDEHDCFRVLHFPLEAELQTTPRPKPLRDPNPSPVPSLPHCRVALRETLTIPDRAPADLSQDDRVLWRSGVRELDYLRGRPSHLLGGHATAIQGPPERVCAMYRYGHAPLAPDDSHPARKELDRYSVAWRLLLQLDSDDACSLEFDTDGGRLYFCVRPSSPPFDHLWAITDGT